MFHQYSLTFTYQAFFKDCNPFLITNFFQVFCSSVYVCVRAYIYIFFIPLYIFAGRQPVCPLNEQFYNCIPTCRNTCDTINNPDIVCDTTCTPGCFCQKGMVRQKDGVCVFPKNCPSM